MERGHIIKVLDHGYVEYVDSMGSDEAIVEAARMSTGRGFISWEPYRRCKKCEWVSIISEVGEMRLCPDHSSLEDIQDFPRGDLGMLEFMYRNKHSTPFEFGEIHIEVQAPIMVFREWHRHRAQAYCLRGSTEISCLSPRGTVYKRSIKEIYDLKYGGVVDEMPVTRNGYSKAGTPVFRQARYKNATRTRVLPNCQMRLLRVLDEENELFVAALMKKVWKSGVKEIFEVHSKNGHTIGGSAEHLFYTREGWKQLSDLRPGDRLAASGKVATMERRIPPILRSGIGIWTSMMRSRLIKSEDECYICGHWFAYNNLELDHIIPVSHDLRRALDGENLKPICEQCHKRKSSKEQPSRRAQTRLGVRWVEIDRHPLCVGEEETYDIEVEGPHHNFVADGLVVHNSEFSARYSQMPDLHYLPKLERVQVQSTSNRQGSGASFPESRAREIRSGWLRHQSEIYDLYELNIREGLSKEVARLNTPVSRYSKMRAKTDLRNWLAFLQLRMAPNAQQEIREYANAVSEVVKALFPHTYQLFEEHDLHGVRLSRSEAIGLAKLVDPLKAADVDVSVRKSALAKLGIS